MEKVKFAGIPFCVASPRIAAKFIVDTVLDEAAGSDFHFLNAYSVSLTGGNADYFRCLRDSAYNFPDGRPIATLSRLGGRSLTQVRGPGLFESVMDVGRAAGLRHYLLGATPATLESLRMNLEQRHPGVQIVGAYSPPFRALTFDEQSAQDEDIRKSKADVVWVGLGTPKQDYEAARLADSGINAVAIGAAFDFSAGTKKEAPEWISRIGLEWLFRFASEPRRLWRRYLIGNFVFLRLVFQRGIQ